MLAYRIEPIRIHCLFAAGPFGDQYSPFASMFTSGVFPLRFYAFLEEVKVCSRSYPARRLDIVVQAASKLADVASGQVCLLCQTSR